MTIAEFIKEQVEARANAAQVLSDPLEINGIKITTGCTNDGIEVSCGLEALAGILDCEDKIETVDEDYKYDLTLTHRTTYFDFNGTRFYKSTYVKKENADE